MFVSKNKSYFLVILRIGSDVKKGGICRTNYFIYKPNMYWNWLGGGEVEDGMVEIISGSGL